MAFGARRGGEDQQRLGLVLGEQCLALLVLTAPPRTESYEKLRLLAVLGQEHFAEAGRGG